MAITAEQFPEDEQSEINLTPMLDVVFIMLIFFIVTAVFIREPGIDVTRPQARTATAPSAIAVYVAISQHNEVWIDGSLIELDDLRYEIERLHQQSPAGDIVIQADAQTHNEFTLAVMDAAKAAGFDSVVLSAESG